MTRDQLGEAKAKLYTANAGPHEAAMLQGIQAQFEMQRQTVLTALTITPQQRSMKTKDYVADLIQWDQYDEQLKQVLAPQMYAVILETGREAMAAIGVPASRFDPFTKQIARYQDVRSTKIARDVNDETEKQLSASITAGLNAGESSYQIRARIEKVFGTASTERADLIARTEVAKAQSFADVEAWSESGLVSEKEWFTAEDERVCKFCFPMNGRRVPLKKNFFNKGDVQTETGTNRKGEEQTYTYNHDYDAVGGPALHPRCRCTLLPVRA